jgi:orotate phosphoribosyltransferase
MEEKLLELLSARRGHFVLESGHHRNLWLDLDSLLLRPAGLLPFARDLARRLSGHGIEAAVGPLVGGAFVAEMVAAELDLRFAFAERRVEPKARPTPSPTPFMITCAAGPWPSSTTPSMPDRRRTRPSPR